jgi:hypothetical protein
MINGGINAMFQWGQKRTVKLDSMYEVLILDDHKSAATVQ